MSTVAKDAVEDALSEIVDPHTGVDLVTGKSLKHCVNSLTASIRCVSVPRACTSTNQPD